MEWLRSARHWHGNISATIPSYSGMLQAPLASSSPSRLDCGLPPRVYTEVVVWAGTGPFSAARAAITDTARGPPLLFVHRSSGPTESWTLRNADGLHAMSEYERTRRTKVHSRPIVWKSKISDPGWLACFRHQPFSCSKGASSKRSHTTRAKKAVRRETPVMARALEHDHDGFPGS
jgi:hypothetical protein